jgi:uncharacterized protein (TIRG00374 family)
MTTGASEPGAGGSTRASHWRRWFPRPLRGGLSLLLFLLVVEVFVLPQLAGPRKALRQLGGVNLGYLLAAVPLEVAALLSYALLTRSVLPPKAPKLFRIFRIDLSTLALSHVIPAGTAGGTGLGIRLLTNEGIRVTDSGVALATQGIGSALVLNALLWLALLVSIPLQGFNPLYVTVALVGVVLIAGFALLVAGLTKGEQHAAAALSAIARHMPFVSEETMTRIVRSVAARVQELGKDRRLLMRAGGWATGNWLFDAAALWVCVAAFGHLVDPISLLVCYGLANVLAAIPITPAGLGVVEATLTSTLVGFGTPRSAALLGVIAYRLVNFWLPIPVGGLAFLSLQVPTSFLRRGQDETAELHPDGDESPRPSRHWAGRLGTGGGRGSASSR